MGYFRKKFEEWKNREIFVKDDPGIYKEKWKVFKRKKLIREMYIFIDGSKSTIYYKDGLRTKEEKVYASGKFLYIYIYKDGVLISAKGWSEDGILEYNQSQPKK